MRNSEPGRRREGLEENGRRNEGFSKSSYRSCVTKTLAPMSLVRKSPVIRRNEFLHQIRLLSFLVSENSTNEAKHYNVGKIF